MRIFLILILSGALGFLGCGNGNDGSDGSGGSGGSGGGGSGGSGGSGGGGSGGSGGSGGGGTGGSGGAGGSGGTGGTGGTDAAAVFCDGFEATCNYVDYDFEDRADCLDFYNTEDAGRVTCVEQHLGFAMEAEPDSADRDLHCGHASGRPPCN